MEYTVTTSRSWFSRLGASVGGVLLGIALIIAGTGLLWWNEGDFVKTRDALNEAQGVTEELEDIRGVDAAANGRLVHAVGPADTQDVLTDPVFGIGGRGIAFARAVEFYQWTESSRSETRQKLGGGEETVTTYSYTTEWVGHPVNSGNFHVAEARSRHVNSVLLAVGDLTLYASNVSFGAYRLPDFFVRSIGGEQPFNVALDSAARARLARNMLRSHPELVRAAGAAGPGARTADVDRIPADSLPAVVHEQGNMLYLGASPAVPQVGDVRVFFTMTPPATVSIIAKVAGNTFDRFKAANGKSVSILSMGEASMEEMYADEHTSNKIITWLLRALGTVLVIGGLRCVFAPLAVLAGVIPMLGSIVGAGTALFSLLLGLAWSLLIMAVAWLRFRPAIGGAMLAVAALLVALLYMKGRGNKGASTPPAAPAA